VFRRLQQLFHLSCLEIWEKIWTVSSRRRYNSFHLTFDPPSLTPQPLTDLLPTYTSFWKLKVMPGPHAYHDFFSLGSNNEFFCRVGKYITTATASVSALQIQNLNALETTGVAPAHTHLISTTGRTRSVPLASQATMESY
jgi:hypothetical protein